MKENNQKKVYIIKANGEKELFNPEKLENSLRRAGADKVTILKIIKKVQFDLRDGMKTSEIYRDAFNLLKEIDLPKASKFSLKRAVMNLGPQGFAFEDFVGAVFKKLGYEVLLRKKIKGLCVSHEVDMIAKNNKRFIMSEIKFHNRQGIKSDLKVVLYVKERFDDIASGEFYRNIDKKLRVESWLITNTKFSSQARQYAECSPGINLMSWDYPEKNNLHDLIGDTGLFPITVLRSLSSSDRKMLLNKNIVLCRDLLEGDKLLFSRVGISSEKTKSILNEVKEILGENY